MNSKTEKIVERVVSHPNLYLSVDGKLQRMAVGTKVSLSEAAAGKLSKKLSDPSLDKKAVEVGKKEKPADDDK